MSPALRTRRGWRVALVLILLGAGLVLATSWRPFDPDSGGSSMGTGDTTPIPTVPPPPRVATPEPSESPGPSTSPGRTVAPEVTVLAAGDIASCGLRGDSDTAGLVEGLEGTVIVAGDLAYDRGTAEQFRECYEPTWGAFKDRTLPVPGNHDWGTPRLAGYLGYWGDRVTSAPGHPWYSAELGTWHVILLDSDCGSNGGCGPDSPQGRWLAGDLAADDARCTLAVWHHPRFSSGQHGNSSAVLPFWTALEVEGADVIVNGHDHDYERFAPQTAAGLAAADGIREFVVGTGGASLRGFAEIRPNSEARLSRDHGVLELTLRDGAYAWRFLNVRGESLDHGEGLCH